MKFDLNLTALISSAITAGVNAIAVIIASRIIGHAMDKLPKNSFGKKPEDSKK